MASVFSLGASSDTCSLPPAAEDSPDLNQAVVRYKADRLSAAELKNILSDAFGNQVSATTGGGGGAFDSLLSWDGDN